MFALLWAKAWKWVCGLGAVLAAFGAVYLTGRSRGKQAGEADAQAARNDVANAQAKTEQLESRHETDAQVARLPDAPVQAVATAAPATAAGELRDNGWVRD
jgi:hypothetical protein